jgi:Dual-action HEIGH metallo-peptidase/Bacterial tandem repeat domain 1
MKDLLPWLVNRKSLIAGMVTWLAIFQFSCNKDFEDVKVAPEPVRPLTASDSLVLQDIKAMGFAGSSIVDMGEYFLVEGDIAFAKDEHDPGKQKAHTEQASTHKQVKFSKQPNITVRVDASIPAFGTDNWRNEIATAINDWNNVTNCRIRFTLTTASKADITFLSDGNSLPDKTVASASFPSGGAPGSKIRINLDFNKNQNLSSPQKRYNMVHELGHCIGLRHTNWVARGETVGSFGANQIPNTPTTDGNSVMNGGTAQFSWAGFSGADITAVQVLYPEPLRFSAIWDHMNTSQVWWPNCSEQEFFNKTDELWAQGFRIAKIYPFVVAGQVRYNVLWNPSDAPQVWWHNCSEEQLRAKTDELWGHGFRIAQMQPFVVNGQVRYSVIWNQTSQPQVWWPNCSEQQFLDKTDELWAQGFRLARLQAFVVNGQVRYSAIWDLTNQPQAWWHNCSEEQLRAKTDELWGHGFRIAQMHIFLVEGQPRYSVIWNPINAPQVWWPNCSEDQMRQTTDELWNSGMRFSEIAAVYAN